MPKNTADHIVLNTAHAGLLQCLHCGNTHDMKLPQPAGAVLALSGWFRGEHIDCELSEKGEACTYCLEFGHKPEACERLDVTTPQEWMVGPDTGTSSMTICRVALGEIPTRPNPPIDPDDFGRCYRLLKLFPHFRARLSDVAAQYPAWGPLVREWDALTSLYEEELKSPSGMAPKLYKRMQDLLTEGRQP
jgi:hypothetical protein